MHDAVPICHLNSEHRLTGIFNAPPVLSCRFLERVDDRLRFFHQHGGMLAAVIAYSAVLPRGYTSGIVGYLRIRVLIDKIQPRFSSSAARTGALCDRVAACKIDALALRTAVDQQPDIFLVLRSESQYFEGTSLSKTSDNEHPSSGLSDSEVFAVKTTPAYAIPQFAKRVKDFFEAIPLLSAKQSGNVFKDKIARSLGFKDSCKLKKRVPRGSANDKRRPALLNGWLS